MTSGKILTKSTVPHGLLQNSPRMGIYVNRKTGAKRRRMMGIEGISPRAFVPVTTIQSKRKSTLADLVKRALRMAYTLRCEVPDGVVFHADRGTQFTSEQLWQVCDELGIAQSVGRTGACFDYAMAESFWSTLETEFYDRKKWRTRDEARKAVACWIEIVCNRRRRHSSIGMISPVDFEAQIADHNGNKKAAA